MTDTKLSAETNEITTFDGDERLIICDDPTGTPADGFVQISTILDAIPAAGVTPYQLAVSVASDDLTVALKNQDGDDPTADDPVRVQIGDTVREITAALSVTASAGTNWCDAGSSELAAREVDYFVYLGYNATDGVTLGFSRIPFARRYDDFSATTTNEKYCAISTITTAAASDAYNVIGRFAATLSAGAGYTWTVPTFTAANLIHQPVFRTRLLTWLPTFTGFSTAPTTIFHLYRIDMDKVEFRQRDFNNGTSNANTYAITLPFTSRNIDANFLWASSSAFAVDNGANITDVGWFIANNSKTLAFTKAATSTGWTATGNKAVRGAQGEYEI